MKNYIKDIPSSIVSLNRYSKRLIAIVTDLGLCILCTWLAFFIRLEELILFKDFNFYPALISVIIAIPVLWLFGIYRTFFRYTSLSIIFSILFSSIVYGLLYFLAIGVYGIQGVPRSIGVLQPILLFFAILTSRLSIKFILDSRYNMMDKSLNKKNVLIYGAGEAGRQLVVALENSPEFRVVGYLDDDTDLHRQYLLGKKIYSLDNLEILLKSKNIDLVFLALPLISRIKRNKIINDLNKFKIKVKTLPSIQEIVDGKISISDIKDLSIEDLLGREQVQPNLELLSKNIISKVVLVTGAGGSIGSELCNQIIRLKPKKLLLIELNEFALYKLNEDLKKLKKDCDIIPLLTNIQNSSRSDEIFKTFKVDTVYHAAAYKHVSLVEENICESVKNNVLGTFQIAKIALKNKVSNFVLVSSDKAVRPTNIMGATKRLSEICVQALYHHHNNNNTKFAIVRFGNVLQSSGSVIPKLKKQIKEGGPVTLTHPEVTRYFMTVIEASQLVIQAGAMSNGCEVFVLDMGESVKIKDLIYKMIKLSGLTVKESKKSDGDIEVKLIGLRPGEKLYEEMLLGDNPQKTFHERIQKAQDPFIPLNELNMKLDKLSFLIEDNKEEEVKDMLNSLIPSYKSNSEIVDHIYKEKLDLNNLVKSSKIINDQENKVIRIKT
jgi:FlaA1/EpsC-like NDP-sugar epimerase